MTTQTEAPSPVADSSADFATRIELPPQLEQAQRSLVAFNDRVLEFVRERPLTCVVGAVAVGFVVAKIASRY